MLAALVPPLLASYLGMAVYLVSLYFNVGWKPEPQLLAQTIVLTTVQGLIMVAGAVVVSTQVTSVRAANLLASFIIVQLIRLARILFLVSLPVALLTGASLPTVIICTGIRSNIELARESGIAVGRGIAVNDAMQTSDPDIYAAGECAEHDGHVYGLVAPGLEQAAVVAAHLYGEAASYHGSVPSTKLKVTGIDLFSAGDFMGGAGAEEIVLSDPYAGVYKKLVIKDDKLIALGSNAMFFEGLPIQKKIEAAAKAADLVVLAPPVATALSAAPAPVLVLIDGQVAWRAP